MKRKQCSIQFALMQVDACLAQRVLSRYLLFLMFYLRLNCQETSEVNFSILNIYSSQ